MKCITCDSEPSWLVKAGPFHESNGIFPSCSTHLSTVCFWVLEHPKLKMQPQPLLEIRPFRKDTL